MQGEVLSMQTGTRLDPPTSWSFHAVEYTKIRKEKCNLKELILNGVKRKVYCKDDSGKLCLRKIEKCLVGVHQENEMRS
jgi:hypothetical protein